MEQTPLQYKNPPVQEAIFSVAFREALPLESIRDFSKTDWVQENYPNTSEHNTDGQAAEPPAQRPGLSMRSANASTLLRFSTTQFSFHVVNNYPGWETARASFLEALQKAGEACSLPALRYASTRYINRLKLGPMSESGLEVNKYLRLVPDLPDDFPGSPGRFFLQVEVFEESKNLEGVIWETLIPPTKDEQLWQVLLDIHVRSTPDQEPAPELTDFLQEGRVFKNSLFESCITPAMRELFN